MIKLIETLIEKGLKERKLKYNLKKTFEKRMNFAQLDDTHIEHESYDEVLDIKNCYEVIKKIEDKYSEYLNYYEKEWESKELRKQWVYYYLSSLYI